MADDEGPAQVSCAWCGTTPPRLPGGAASSPPVTWTVQTSARGLEYLCERCTRDNVRKIEGSLPTDYW